MVLRLLAAVCFLLTVIQTPTPVPEVTGSVVTEDGKPVSGVEVHGSKIDCCPRKFPSPLFTRTDGSFRISDPGPVLHFRKSNYQPATVVLDGATVSLMMSLSGDNVLRIPSCMPSKEKRFGTQFGSIFSFLRPPKVKFKSSADVDYLRYFLKDKRGNYMNVYVGPYAGSQDAAEDRFLNSKSFTERNVVMEGRTIGIDARGISKDGSRWRHISLTTNSAEYRTTDDEATQQFGEVMDSVCYDNSVIGKMLKR